jgi:cyclohexanone monooxygenase
MSSVTATRSSVTTIWDAIVVGAGFAGLYAAHAVRSQGLSCLGFEAAPDVGGVWHWNRYPGARCDVESMQYSFGFDEALQQDWVWKERFAQQPEILDYLRHVADRFGLRQHFRFDTRVSAATFDEAGAVWCVRTDGGDLETARVLIMASGGLSVTRLPDMPGATTFHGQVMHTGDWPTGPVDFGGKRVGVIGTGSSGIQAIPVIAGQAAQVIVFQRTPNFVIPARNRLLDDATQSAWKSRYGEYRARAKQVGTFYEFSDRSALSVSEAERQAEYDRRWAEGGVNFVHAFNDIYMHEPSNRTAADYVRAKIRSIVKDPATAERLCPKDHPLGSKRICVGSDYYETFNRPNVTLVDLREDPIEAITPQGVRLASGEVPLDVLVCATGYDALTGALMRIDIRGRDGLRFAEKWKDGPVNALGLMTAGFPNMFIVTGPGSPSVLVNMVVGIEQHIEWIVRCMLDLRAGGYDMIEPESETERAWVRHVNEVAERTLFVKANSWYLGANVPGKPRVFMPYAGGIGPYRRKCDEVAAAGYEGFCLGRIARASEDSVS